MLDCWRVHRAPELAALLDAVSRELDRSLPPLLEKKRTSAKLWLETSGRKRASDVGRLLSSLADGASGVIKQRLERLVPFAPDPRLGEPALTLAASYQSFSAAVLLNTALDLITRTNDPRGVDQIDRVIAASLTPGEKDSPALKDHLEKQARKATKARGAIKPAPALSPAVLAQVAAATRECERLAARTEVPALSDTSSPETFGTAKRGGGPSLEELRDAVLADFTDDEKLVIYSDALQQAGDPRGELIALQLEEKKSSAASQRERELLKLHGRALAAPLDVVLKPDALRFERGFLHACRVDGGTAAERAALVGHPLWSTVRELDCDDMAFATHPVFAGVQSGTYSGEALSTLAKRDIPVALESVIGTFEMIKGFRLRTGQKVDQESRESWDDALEVGALTSLRSLQLLEQPFEQLTWLLDSKLGKQLRHLDIFGDPPLAPWLDWLSKRATEMTLRFRFPNWNTSSGSIAILATFDIAWKPGAGFSPVEVTFNNEMVDLRYLTMPNQLKEFLANVASHELGARVRYSGSKKRATMGFPAIVALLGSSFAELVLE